MVFPAVTRRADGSSNDAHASTAPASAAGADGKAYARFEACLAEVHLLELGFGPNAGEQWATRYWAATDARNAELTAYGHRHHVLGALNAALAIAALAGVATGHPTPTALAAIALLGLSIDVAWAVSSRSGARRLADWEARLEALASDDDHADRPIVAEARRPGPATGASLLIVAFGAFWVAVALGCLLAPDLVIFGVR